VVRAPVVDGDRVLVAAITFGIVFLAEIADTSGLATMVLGTRFPPRWVLIGVFAGMLVHVVVAVAAGTLVALLPERPLAAVIAVIFFVGAFLLLREDDDDDDATERKTPTTRWGVITTAFLVTALSEFADPSQIIIATLAARYDDPIAVGIGALLGLWAVSALAVLVGNRLQRLVPVRWVTRIAAAILIVLGILSAIEAIRG
jgi:Ca2+/H+ antiporter, TMEM165/GDT1 family